MKKVKQILVYIFKSVSSDFYLIDSCKHVFVWDNCMIDPVAYLLISVVLCIRYVEELFGTSHLHFLFSVLRVLVSHAYRKSISRENASCRSLILDLCFDLSRLLSD